ncbi:Calcium/calmodulin-dependent 3',5'-cyclic nucleotide phosphodiesterase 1B [Perkinsus olseni]|uniref:Phosphodiesterase n=2 Tax=Perkinsus olseni TaxID=32597 RepID=A0A7J6NS64_PEROL|nr:Calcium/calmodulin-dependent 3',5'-cyclic nucleotide phosphodiesterase 1B [Perkinsus olseni]
MPSTSPGMRSEPLHRRRRSAGTDAGRRSLSAESASSEGLRSQVHVGAGSSAASEVEPPFLLIPDLTNAPGGAESTNISSRTLPAIPEPVPEDVLKPIGEIDERREKLMQWERVKLHKRTMVFSVPRFERAYLLSLEPKLRRSLWVPAVAFIAFALVCLLYPSIWVSKWDTSANILFNSCWLVIASLGLFVLFTFPFSLPPSRYLELYIQVWTGFTMTAATIFGTPYRVATITGTDYSVAFPGANLGVADISVFLDLITIMYFSVYTPLRIRRLFPVAVAINCLYAGISIGFGVPSYGTNSDVIESSSTDRWFALSLTLVLILSSILCLTGKYRLELFQRTNFLRLEVSQRRIDVLERTIVAFDSSNDKATRVTQMQLTHKVRKSEKSLFVLDFQKEVLMEGMSSHEQQRMASGETPKSGRFGQSGRPRPCSIPPVLLGTIHPHVKCCARIESNSCSCSITPGGEDSAGVPPTACFVDDYEPLLRRVGRDFTLDVEELWGSHQEESRCNPDCVLALYRAVARACFPDDQANRILNIGSEAPDGPQCPVYERFLAEVCSRYLISAESFMASFSVLPSSTPSGIRSALSDLDWASLVIACMCHDVGHFGRTNKFLVETRHPLALRYNDRSVMENYHAATMFDMLKESEDWDISRGLSRSELKRFRSQIVALILSTDLGATQSLLDQIKGRVEAGTALSVSQFPEDSRLIRELSICMADCGHVWLTWDLHYKWAVRLSSEFAAEARELATMRAGLGTPLTSSLPGSDGGGPAPAEQISFIEQCPVALVRAMQSLVDLDGGTEFASTASEWSKAVEKALLDNASRWREMEAEEVSRRSAEAGSRGSEGTPLSSEGATSSEERSGEAPVDSGNSPADQSDDDDDVPMMSYREMYGGPEGRSSEAEDGGVGSSGIDSDDEPPMLSYSALYNADGTSNVQASRRPVPESAITSSGEPPLLSYSALYRPDGTSIVQPTPQRDSGVDDDDDGPPLMSYSELYGRQQRASSRSAVDDSHPPTHSRSYDDSYTRTETAIVEEPSNSETSESPDKIDNNEASVSAVTNVNEDKPKVAAEVNAGDSPGSDPLGWAVDKLLSRIVKENSIEQLIALLSEMTKKALFLQHQLDMSNTRNNQLLGEIEELKNALDEERRKFQALEPPAPPPPVAPATYAAEVPNGLGEMVPPGRAVSQLSELYEKHHIDREAREMLSNSRKIRRPDQRQMVIDLFLEKVGHEQGKDVLAALKGLPDFGTGDPVPGADARHNRRMHNRRGGDQQHHPLHARSGPENRSWLFAQCVKEIEFKIQEPQQGAPPQRHNRNDYYDYNRAKWSGNNGRNNDRGVGAWAHRRDASGW